MSCCVLPGEPRSQLWSTTKTAWAAIAFFMLFVAVFSNGSLISEAMARPGYLMFSSVVALAFFTVPIAHREWTFGRSRQATLIVIGWLIACGVFVQAFVPVSQLDSVTVGLPRGLLALLGLASAIMAYRAPQAKWPGGSEDDVRWSAQLASLLGRYYSWRRPQVDQALLACRKQAADAGMSLQEAFGEPWQVAEQFATNNPENQMVNARLPLMAGIVFLALAVATFAIDGVSAFATLEALLGFVLVGFSKFVTQ